MDAPEEERELSVDVTRTLRSEGEVNEAQRQGGEHKEEVQKVETACAKPVVRGATKGQCGQSTESEGKSEGYRWRRHEGQIVHILYDPS